MKTAVNDNERADNRAIPHTPWPDVHPAPIREPIPTRSPEATTTPRFAGRLGCGRGIPKIAPSRGAASNPAMNATRQSRSPVLGASRPPNIPLIPAMRPVSSISSADASPMMAPPRSPEMGVKLCMLLALVRQTLPQFLCRTQNGASHRKRYLDRYPSCNDLDAERPRERPHCYHCGFRPCEPSPRCKCKEEELSKCATGMAAPIVDAIDHDAGARQCRRRR